MRVLMLSKACIVGIYQRKLELIAQQGIELLTLVPPSWRDERGEQMLERVYTQGYRLETTPIRFNGNFHLHYYPQLGQALRTFRPQLVHIDEEPYNLATWQALYLARQAGAKSLFFSWQNILRQYPPPFSWGESWVLKHIDYALMGTDSAAEVWREKGYTGPLKVIPQFGTDPDLFQPAATRPERPFTIGYVGRLVEEKGLLPLLDALAGLAGAWQLRMIGGGPLQERLQAKAQELGIAQQIEFVAQQPSSAMPSLMQSIDVLVLPSLTRPNWKEQFGRVIVEAMACALPVLGSDSGAIPGVVGAGGLIHPEGDSATLRAHLAQLQADPDARAVLGQAGRARVLAHYTHARVASETVEVYRAVADLQT